jgi:hypothetical protein
LDQNGLIFIFAVRVIIVVVVLIVFRYFNISIPFFPFTALYFHWNVVDGGIVE